MLTNQSKGNNRNMRLKRWRAFASCFLGPERAAEQMFGQRLQMKDELALIDKAHRFKQIGIRKMPNEKPSDIVSTQPLESPSDDGSLTAIRKRKNCCHLARGFC
jgi:hypothetical protein